MKKIGLIGARGYTGRELLARLQAHTGVELVVAASSSAAGARVPGFDLDYVAPSPSLLRGLDGVFLALPNGTSAPYVAAAAADTAVVDLSADHRFDDAFAYGLVERQRARLRGHRRIANPGCYATAMQLALGPITGVLSGPPVVFGVSGYSGAGKTPSRRNDPDVLRDNLLPYALLGHIHEREARHHLGIELYFHPHVAPHFRGITLTISCPVTSDNLRAHYAVYDDEPLVEVIDGIPEVRDIAYKDGVCIGGIEVKDGRAVIVATIDNLNKGASVQAMQNMNLALGFDEYAGVL